MDVGLACRLQMADGTGFVKMFQLRGQRRSNPVLSATSHLCVCSVLKLRLRAVCLDPSAELPFAFRCQSSARTSCCCCAELLGCFLPTTCTGFVKASSVLHYPAFWLQLRLAPHSGCVLWVIELGAPQLSMQ